MSDVAAAQTPSRLRRIAPALLAVALVAVTLARLDLGAFAREIARVNPFAFLALATGAVLALLSADSFATLLVYRRIAPVRFGEFLFLRGASYLPSLLNHHVGQAYVALHLSRAYGVPFARVAGATLLVYASWIGCLLTLGSVSLLLWGQPIAVVLAPIGIGVVYLVILTLRPPWLARQSLLAPLFEAGARGHLAAMATRVPHFIALFLATWLPFFFFGVHIPFADALLYVPILMVVVTLPITPQGVGTRDVLAAVLFERFAEGATHQQRLAAIAAATTSWAVALTLVEIGVGMACLKRAARSSSPRPNAVADDSPVIDDQHKGGRTGIGA